MLNDLTDAGMGDSSGGEHPQEWDDFKWVFWFDSDEKGLARGIPEGEFNEFFIRFGGSCVITHRYYRRPGYVASAIVELVGGAEAAQRGTFIGEALREFIPQNFGLDCIYREYRGQDIGERDGRWYSDIHDPMFPDVPAEIGSDWRLDPRRQSASDHAQRLQEGRCPLHGVKLSFSGFSLCDDHPLLVKCTRQGCSVIGHQARGGVTKLAKRMAGTCSQGVRKAKPTISTQGDNPQAGLAISGHVHQRKRLLDAPMNNPNADGEKLLDKPGTSSGAYLLAWKWIGGLALLGLIGYPVVSAAVEEWQAASVDEIRTVIGESGCAKRLLADANSSASEITHRDLKKVRVLCQPIDQQSKAFD